MTVLDNVLTGMDRTLRGGIVGMALRLPGIRRDEQAAARAGPRVAATSSAWKNASGCWPRIFPTAISVGWRSPAPWPPSRKCCCWTSPPPA